jgi:hypothetical protein
MVLGQGAIRAKEPIALELPNVDPRGFP